MLITVYFPENAGSATKVETENCHCYCRQAHLQPDLLRLQGRVQNATFAINICGGSVGTEECERWKHSLPLRLLCPPIIDEKRSQRKGTKALNPFLLVTSFRGFLSANQG